MHFTNGLELPRESRELNSRAPVTGNDSLIPTRGGL